MSQHLHQVFHDQFEIVPADTLELKREAFRIRFSVYSEELCLPGFEPWHYPDGLETDAYDAHSAHCLLRHKPTATWAGTVRLVLASPLDIATPFPIEVAAGGALDLTSLHGVGREHIAEISRLVLTKPYRHFPNSLPLLSLLAAVGKPTVDNEVTHWLFAIEPPLKRLLNHLGIELASIGPTISYHGVRKPYLGEVSAVIDRLEKQNPLVLEILSTLVNTRGI